ncbi:hypothetical protein [Bacillus velezensis]|uniref:hypothetical protein n=1 Tax=Bacillus velezensis TaxID=492670 RepID=UPI0018E7B833|nr:hypothetical protein [Bacillus velezensis]
MVIIVNIDKKEVKAMITIYGILYGENAKIGNILADKGAVCPFKPNHHTKTVIGAFSLCQINDNPMT